MVRTQVLEIVGGFSWGVIQAIAVIVAVSLGSSIPILVKWDTRPGAWFSQPPIIFTQGIPGYVAHLVIVACALLIGFLLADYRRAMSALFLSQIVSFAVVVGVLLGMPSPISSIPDYLQFFFVLAFLGYFSIATMACSLGVSVGKRLRLKRFLSSFQQRPKLEPFHGLEG